MHLRVKFLRRRPREVGPGDVVQAKIVGAVFSIPDIVTVCPRQSCGEGGVEIEKRPSNNSVVIEGNIKGNDAYGIANT